METIIETEIEYSTYLVDKLVTVKPVESSGKWASLLVKGEEKRKDPFLYNKTKRSFQVPLNPLSKGGGIKVILEDQKRRNIKKYMEKFPKGMTQKEFFEEELGVDLNPYKADNNFWRVDQKGRVMVSKEGLKLNLNLPLDMLKYLILLSDTQHICPSFEERLNKATYEFMIVDENIVMTKKVEEAQLKSKAYIKYAEIASSPSKVKGFIKSLGRAIPATATEDWLKGEVLTVIENSPARFLEFVNHPQYNERIFVQEAIEAGAIIRKANDHYTLDNGVELGDLVSTVNYMLDAENQELKLRIKNKIDLAKRK